MLVSPAGLRKSRERIDIEFTTRQVDRWRRVQQRACPGIASKIQQLREHDCWHARGYATFAGVGRGDRFVRHGRHEAAEMVRRDGGLVAGHQDGRAGGRRQGCYTGSNRRRQALLPCRIEDNLHGGKLALRGDDLSVGAEHNENRGATCLLRDSHCTRKQSFAGQSDKLLGLAKPA